MEITVHAGSIGPGGPGPVVGVDVSKARLDVAQEAKAQIRSWSNDAVQCRALAQYCRRAGVSRVVVESTGGYERDLLLELLEHKVPVSVVNPRVVRDFARSYNLL